MTSLVYKDDIGTRLLIDTQNHTLAITTTFAIIFKKPSGTVITATPTSFNYTTGIATYDTVAGDLDEAGEYQVQLNAAFDDGDTLRSNKSTFPVYDIIE
jgi:hypothetical protein